MTDIMINYISIGLIVLSGVLVVLGIVQLQMDRNERRKFDAELDKRRRAIEEYRKTP